MASATARLPRVTSHPGTGRTARLLTSGDAAVAAGGFQCQPRHSMDTLIGGRGPRGVATGPLAHEVPAIQRCWSLSSQAGRWWAPSGRSEAGRGGRTGWAGCCRSSLSVCLSPLVVGAQGGGDAVVASPAWTPRRGSPLPGSRRCGRRGPSTRGRVGPTPEPIGTQLSSSAWSVLELMIMPSRVWRWRPTTTQARSSGVALRSGRMWYQMTSPGSAWPSMSGA